MLYSFVCIMPNREEGLTPIKSKLTTPNLDHHDVIKDGDLIPGHTVITDQYECRVNGKIPNTRGREDPQKMYCGGTLFFITHHQTSMYIIKFFLEPQIL